ncbi:MAG: FAD-dependent oxidoreductase [Proteobacteria bacterium]|nr:FAD-dependent oxidoreductase [Pseudomonadota bacterium]
MGRLRHRQSRNRRLPRLLDPRPAILNQWRRAFIQNPAVFERRASEIDASRKVFQYEILDTEVFKYLADQMIQEAGIKPLLHCVVVDVIVAGNSIQGVIAASKSGRQAILAKRVIDATGDADIAFRSGAPCRMPSKEKWMAVK